MGAGDNPDEVYEAPGLRIERRGRYTSIHAHRTREEFRQWIRSLIQARPRLLQEIETATQELLALVHKYNSLELLAQLWFVNSVGDPNEYKEYSYEGRMPYVEHLATMELKDPEYAIHSMDIPDRNDINKAQSLLDRIFQYTLLYYFTEDLDPDRYGPPAKLEQLRLDTIKYELLVRSPTYYSHWEDILRELFGSEPVATWMDRELGVDINQTLRCVQATSDLMMKRINDRRDRAKAHESELYAYVQEFKRTGTFSGPKDVWEIVNRIRNMRGKQSKQAIRAISISWTFYELHDTLSFTAHELSDAAAVPQSTAEAFLSLFSLKFGTTQPDYLLPQPTNPLRARPLIRNGNKFFCPAVHLLLWAIKGRIESCLKPGRVDSVNTATGLWEAYQKHRGDFLVSKSLGLLKKLLPSAQVYQGLKYHITEDGIQKEVELDGLVIFDRYAFLLEGKAGEFSSSARKGNQKRLLTDLKKLVAEPHKQALRALAYIRAVQTPILRAEDDRIVSFKKDLCKEYILVTVTLESLDVYTAELYQLRDVGIFGTAELPWAVCLNDLRIIAETVNFPSEFTHYLQWRLNLNQLTKVSAQSELDWLGYYLSGEPRRIEVPPDYDVMKLATYTTEFDDFYLYEQGQRTIPAKRPSQFIPPGLHSLLRSLERHDGHGYTAVSEVLLSLTFEERRKFETELHEYGRSLRKGNVKERRFIAESAVVVLRTTGMGTEDLNSLALSIANESRKTVAVVQLVKEEPEKVTGWGIYETPSEL